MWTATCGRALRSTIVQIKAAGAGLVCYVTPFTSPSILKLYKVWKNHKIKYLSIFIILLTSSASALDELEPLNWGGNTCPRRRTCWRTCCRASSWRSAGWETSSKRSRSYVGLDSDSALHLCWFFFLSTTWDSSATYLFHFGWVHLLVDILTNATNNQRVSV